MLIGEIAIKTGLSRDTIRFYEREGLIKVGKKQRRNNNYKEYDDKILERLHTIKRIKTFGFTLNETAELLSLIDINAASCNEVSHRVDEKILVIEQKINDLLNLRRQLTDSVQICRTSWQPGNPDDNCPIIMQGRSRKNATGITTNA